MVGGVAFTAWSNYNSTGGDIPLTVAETAVDTAVVMGATKVGPLWAPRSAPRSLLAWGLSSMVRSGVPREP